MNQQIENNFKHHPPKAGQVEKYEAIRAKAKELAYLLEVACPHSREKSLAMTNLEQVMFWGNAAVARNTANDNPAVTQQPGPITPYGEELAKAKEWLAQGKAPVAHSVDKIMTDEQLLELYRNRKSE